MSKKRVLILCTGNSARSQMAEAIINAERGDTWEAVSAGTQPAERVNPYAIRALQEMGIHTEGSRPQHISDFHGQAFDVVITVCDDAAENCPVWVGQGQRVHVSFPDPAAYKPAAYKPSEATGSDDEILSVFRTVRDDIQKRVLSTLDQY